MVMPFPIVAFILFAISITSLVTFYLSTKIKLTEGFDRVFKFIVFYFFLNSTYSFIIEIFYPESQWKDRIAPFLLLYGPLLYYAIIALRDKKLPTITIILHALPFFYYLCFYLALKFGILPQTPEMHLKLSKQLLTLGPISFLVYATLSAFISKHVFKDKLKEKLLIFVFGRIVLIFLAMLLLIIAFSKQLLNDHAAIYLLRILVYLCMLIFIALVFNFTIKKLMGKSAPVIEEEEDVIKGSSDVPRYEKSSLTENQLKRYQEKLDHVMQNEKLFLDATLSLSSLANHLKIPNHHITQVLSMQMNQTFYQFVNGFRIAHACKLLASKQEDMNFEELALKSGFNTTPSFNRQFKAIMNCTPSAYRDQLK